MTIRERISGWFSRQPEKHQSPVKNQPESMMFFSNSGPIGIGWYGQKTQRGLPATEIVYRNNREMQRQAAKIHLESTHAQSIVSRIADLTVSTGVRLESTPVWDICAPDMPVEDREIWVKQHEQLWKLYATSKEPDASGQMTFAQLQHFAKIQKIIYGEYFFIVRYLNDPERVSKVALQAIHPHQVSMPDKQEYYEAAQKAGNVIHEGIEIDSLNRPVAYFVWSGNVCTKIHAYNRDKSRPYVIHGFEQKEVGQVRGISDLSGVLHDLAKMTDYTVAELAAAVINASIAAYVKPGQMAPSSKPLNTVLRKDEMQIKDETVKTSLKSGKITEPGLFIQNLEAGEDITSFNTSRPNVNFGNFMKDTMKYIAGSRGIAVEVVEQSFSQSYSAARAGLKLTWVRIEVERAHEVDDFYKPVHEIWFKEALKARDLQAKGFNSSPKIRKAWLQTNWIGLSAPDLDPLKTVNARRERINLGLSDLEKEAQDENGSSFADNIAKLREQMPKLREVVGMGGAVANETVEVEDDTETDDETDDETQNQE